MAPSESVIAQITYWKSSSASKPAGNSVLSKDVLDLRANWLPS
jgi:hypothetical protein